MATKRICEECTGEFEPTKSTSTAKFCSKLCRADAGARAYELRTTRNIRAEVKGMLRRGEAVTYWGLEFQGAPCRFSHVHLDYLNRMGDLGIVVEEQRLCGAEGLQLYYVMPKFALTESDKSDAVSQAIRSTLDDLPDDWVEAWRND